MALNKLAYGDIPHVPHTGGRRVPGLHPYKAPHPHEYRFLDGRQLEVRVDGAKWWGLIILAGCSRAILAGAIAPTEATTIGGIARSQTSARGCSTPRALRRRRGLSSRRRPKSSW
jgi:hypothetical protein